MFDIIIIGCGPSGMSCAVYASRAGKKVLVLEKSVPGGQMLLTNHIHNYPGFVDIDGASLASNMFEQISTNNIEVKFEEVIKCDFAENVNIITTNENVYNAKSVFICTGASARQLDVINEKKYINKGLSYCATCDGAFFKNQSVAVVGGGNTSFEDALYLSNIAKQVFLIHRRDTFKADEIYIRKIKELEKSGKVILTLNSAVTNIIGDDKIEQIEVKNIITKKTEKINVNALFVAIGRKPDTDIFGDALLKDKNGYIIANENMETNIKGVFCGGDVRNTNLRQIVTACSDGAIGATKLVEYLNNN